jgi:atypical dual specificity phosphatase
MKTLEGPSRFSWILPGQLAGSGRPGRYTPLEQDLAFLRHEGVDVIISLLESTLNLDAYVEAGFDTHHFPVEDFTAPTLDQIANACDVIETAISRGGRVLVHCNAGIGRTGTILACFLAHQGVPPETAVQRIRTERPLSLETKDQVLVVAKYFESRHKAK